jgi:hypothetical protein
MQFSKFGHHQQASKGKKIGIIIGAVVLVAALGAAGYFYWQYTTLKANPQTVASEKTTRISDKVAKLYALPDETPTIAEISDKEKLKDQAFFNNSQNGDFLLIFPNSKLAIIYREVENKLINVGPISLNSDETKTP